MHKKQRGDEIWLAPSSILIQISGRTMSSIARPTAIAAMNGKNIRGQFVLVSNPGHIERARDGIPKPITLRGRTSFNAAHSR
jgi:hypothetical protein